MRAARNSTFHASASTLIIVLWIALGLVSITLYFAHSMISESRAADYRVQGLSAEQAIEGGIRYACAVLSNRLTNGCLPEPGAYSCAAVPLSNTAGRQGVADASARFWFIGRDTNSISPSRTVAFGLVDESSKINLNSARSNVFFFLTGWSVELTEAILDWRSTNGPGTTLALYGMQTPFYECKQAPFETVDELRLVFGAAPELLEGEDLNRNGVLDADEEDVNRDGIPDKGLLDLVTVYTREPNTYSNGTPRVNVRVLTSASPDFRNLLQENFGQARANDVLQRLGIGSGRGAGAQASFSSPLQFFRRSGLNPEEFELIADKITFAQGDFIEGRININTAASRVLACLPGLEESPDLVELIVNYRLSFPDRLGSVAWLVEALGESNQETLSQLERQDILTTRSYQFTADIAATGAFGRGYRRVRCVIDTATDWPRVVYRQDLTSLGWALGGETREQLLQQNTINGPLAFN